VQAALARGRHGAEKTAPVNSAPVS
jgi:hypothetical protein